MESSLAPIIYPQQEGDLYWVTGYPASGMNSFGVAVFRPDRTRPGYEIWNLGMSDGDYYPWEKGQEFPDMCCDEVHLVKRMADIKREAKIAMAFGDE